MNERRAYFADLPLRERLSECETALRNLFDQFKGSAQDQEQVVTLRAVRALLARVDGGGR